MLEDVTKWIGTFAPFLAPYPVWVKSAFVVFVLSGATCLTGLIVAAPKTPNVTPAGSTGNTPQLHSGNGNAWLTIQYVKTWDSTVLKTLIRVRFKVNGINYIYPSFDNVEWQAFGPDQTTSKQTFQIPVSDDYTVNFKAEFKNGMEWINAEDQHVKADQTQVYTFKFHEFRRDEGRRDSVDIGELRYTIRNTPP